MSNIDVLLAFSLVQKLLANSITSIWVAKCDGGNNVVKVREAPSGDVVEIDEGDFGALIAAICNVLAGEHSLDVTNDQVVIKITEMTTVDGTEWALTVE